MNKMMNGVVIAGCLFGLFACGVDPAPSADEGSDAVDTAQRADKLDSPPPDASDEVAPRAGSSCPGTRIEHIPLKPGSPALGFLDVYFDSATGNNCALTVSAGSAAGKASSIDVCLIRCKETSPGPICTFDGESCDSGPFHSFAGPVFEHAPGHCISAFGDLQFGNTFVSAELSGATHCG
jgi:hypothetical protein